ncbi:MAG: UDP-N-acetylmuramoyl-L-alanine--D-glutamate ligase [Candidatus Omnitrophota bacterium]
MDFQNKNITIIGLGRSGTYAAILAQDLGARVKITESQETPAVKESLTVLTGRNLTIEVGRHSQDFILGQDLIIASPGVPPNSEPIKWAENNNIPIISEIEFAFLVCPAPIVAITGTNGKTTVTTLIAEVLQKTKRRVFACGNIGEPFTKVVSQIKKEDLVSLEASSFQLQRTKKFHPKVAVILNFTPDHLNYHKDLEEYLEAKKRIFLNQKEDDWAILNYQDKVVRDLSKETKAKVLFFNKKLSLNPNFEAASITGEIFGVSKKESSEIFRDFKGIEHRLEYIGSIKDVDFINDSKATNVDSTIWALNRITKPIILIAGGRDKGTDYSPIYELIKSKVKHMFVIGEAKDKIKTALSKAVKTEEAASLKEAMEKGLLIAQKGDSVLLSPMCASFDMFINYEDRGDTFRREFLELKKIYEE